MRAVEGVAVVFRKREVLEDPAREVWVGDFVQAQRMRAGCQLATKKAADKKEGTH